MDSLFNTLKSILIFIVGSYALVCALLYLGQRKMLYYPQPAAEISGLREISFQNGDVNLRGWLLNPGKDKALLYYGGNAEQIEYNADFFQSQLGNYSVYLVAYRGYGHSEGKPSETALYADAMFVYDQLQDQYQSISVMGRSLGTGVATYLAVNRPLRKLVLVSPYDSIEKLAQSNYWMIPVKFLLRDKYSSWQRAPRITVPTLIIYGQQDQVVPAEHTQALIQHFDQSLLTVVAIPGAEHASIAQYQQYQEAVVGFLR